MSLFTESSLEELYASAVAAFPKTRMRQHAIQPIVVESISWTPYLGLGTLFIKGEVRNETRHYSPLVLFKGVNYGLKEVKITASNGKEYEFGKLSEEQTDCTVRCDCPDFRWRFAWYNKLDRSLFGRAPTKYESNGGPPANPKQLPGMCKHLIQLATALQHAGIFQD